MVRKVLAGIAALAVLLVSSGAVPTQRGKAQTPPPTPETPRTVSVSGTGEVRMEPDRAVIQLGVQTEADSPGEALAQNNQQMQAVLDTLRGAGAADDDIQTISLQLFPRYAEAGPPPGGQPQVVGYTAINIVEVRWQGLGNLGTFLDEAVQAGGNVVQSIRFEVSDPSTALSQAREQAVNDARQTAEALASLVGASLGEVIAIHEQGSTPRPIPLGQGGEVAAAVPVEPGSQPLQVVVSVTWELISGSEPIPATGTEPAQGSVRAVTDRVEPGAPVRVEGQDLPPNTVMEIGIGEVGTEVHVMELVRTDANGILSAIVIIPASAQAGEQWRIVLISHEEPSVRITSEPFPIRNPEES